MGKFELLYVFEFLFLLRTICYAATYTCSLQHVEIVTMGLVTNATTISMHNVGPSYDLAATFFRTDHGARFNLTHTYLMDESITNCVDLTSQTTFMMSEWYFKKRINADVYAFIIPS